MAYEPNYEQRQRIANAADWFFHQILSQLAQGEIEDIEQAREALSECNWNECAVAGLGLDDQLDLAQEYGSDLGMDLGDVCLDDLRAKIDRLATAVIHNLAEQTVAQWLDQIEDLMEEFGLDLGQVSDSNHYGCFVHRAERYPAEECTVMEYRDVEELGQSVDVWQVRFGDGWKLYFEVSPGVD